MRRPRQIVAILVLVSGSVFAAIYFLRPKVVTVCVFSDPAFRQRANWSQVLQTRLAAVSRIYERQTGLRWKVVDASRSDPTAERAGLDSRRAALALQSDCDADLMLGISGQSQGARTASVSPFSHGAIVVDDPAQAETRNTLVLAHELAHLFGAVHDTGADTLMAAEPTADTFAPRTVRLIRRLRAYPFAKGVKGLQEDGWDARVTAALSETLNGLARDPDRQAHQIIAAALVADGVNGAAVPHLQIAVKDEPANVQARFELAVALERDSQEEKALETLREGVKLNPASARLHSALGAVLLKRNREEAIDEFLTSLRLDPGNAQLYAALGGVLASGMGRIDGAIAAYENALKLDPGMVEARQGLNQALASKAEARNDAVVKRLQAARRPDSPEASYDLGVAEARAGNFDAAAKAFDNAIRLRPGFGLAHSRLALIHYLHQAYPASWKEVKAARALGNEPDAAFIEALTRKMPL